MRVVALTVATGLLVSGALAQDVPFATPSLPGIGARDMTDMTSLADIMDAIQRRHVRLWFAARSNNWGLAAYTINRINESLRRAANLYVGIPVDHIQAVGKPMTDIKAAVTAKDIGQFTKSYSALTAACNACHVAGQVGFIKIQIPTSSPFSDQAFGP